MQVLGAPAHDGHHGGGDSDTGQVVTTRHNLDIWTALRYVWGMKKPRKKDKAKKQSGSLVRMFSVFIPKSNEDLTFLINNGPSIDARAISGDWQNIGADINSAMRKLDLEQSFQ